MYKDTRYKYMVFRSDLFMTALKRAVEHTLKDIGETIVKKAKSNISRIDFHHYPVQLAGSGVPKAGLRKSMAGYSLTDATRKTDLLQSVILGKIQKSIENKRSVAIRTMVSNFKDSHIGIYYEHGTGQYQDGTFTRVSGAKYEYSKNRPGNEIYTRPGEEWTDLGGNKRISYAGNLKRLPSFAVRPEHWFAKAVKEAENKLDETFHSELNKQLSKIPIDKLVYLKKNIVIGRSR